MAAPALAEAGLGLVRWRMNLAYRSVPVLEKWEPVQHIAGFGCYIPASILVLLCFELVQKTVVL